MRTVRILRFLARTILALLLLAGACLLYASQVEPRWLKVKTVRLHPETARRCRLALLSDIHYGGDRASLRRVVDAVNRARPDFVCFAGDLADDAGLAEEAAAILAGIRAPVYAVHGNHDVWERTPRRDGFAAGGGGWIDNRTVLLMDGNVGLTGLPTGHPSALPPDAGAPVRILLCHYPAVAGHCGGRTFDLVLAGHSHGGQVRVPFFGALFVPYDTGRYETGLHQTPAGPLYVTPGTGTFFYSVRFNCRPEVTILEL